METIKEFKDNYDFLSNYYECKVIYNGYIFNSAEAAYHAQKHPQYSSYYIGKGADESKKFSRTLPLREDWENVKVQIMKEIVEAKFRQNFNLCQKLLETGDAALQDGNWWGDAFWGIREDGVGENILGKILMEIRAKLKKEYTNKYW